MSLALQHLQIRYMELQRSVTVALQTQLGDAARLNEHKRLCLHFLHDLQQYIHELSPTDVDVIYTSVHAMVESLESGVSASLDVPDAPPPQLGGVVHTDRPGCPSINIQPEHLALLAAGRTTHLEIARLYQCSTRTIRRCLLAYGLSEPGPPVYVEEERDGNVVRIYSAGRSSELSQITDEELDSIMLSIYERFPSFGRRMIDGYLMALGERIPRSRILESYRRTIGPPVSTYGNRRIERRVYSVPGPNSLWHHDGQHGLIRWKIIFHAFIDGYSRFVLGVWANPNNRAVTVMYLFHKITGIFGYPSRIRGDHGTENLLVAGLMEQVQGQGRGSYIWGKSVHNIRIERLWLDITRAFGAKWKTFFEILEGHDGLDVNSDVHLWLLHHLFLDAINVDIEQWIEAWNSHTLARRGQHHQTPHQMYLHGMIENGVRGIRVEDDPDNIDPDTYGIDWEDIERRHLREHHDVNNPIAPNAEEYDNPFVVQQPTRLSHVPVPDPNCPFTPEQITYFNSLMSALPHIHLVDMHSRRLTWIDGLRIAIDILA